MIGDVWETPDGQHFVEVGPEYQGPASNLRGSFVRHENWRKSGFRLEGPLLTLDDTDAARIKAKLAG